MTLRQAQHFPSPRSTTSLLQQQPLLSPLANESQNPLFWKKGGRADLAEMTLDQLSACFSPKAKAFNRQGNPPPPCLAAAAASRRPESHSTSPPLIWPQQERMRFQLVSVSLQSKTAGEWTGGCPPDQRGPHGVGVGQCVFFCPEALSRPVS